jgi:hypothetical protein
MDPKHTFSYKISAQKLFWYQFIFQKKIYFWDQNPNFVGLPILSPKNFSVAKLVQENFIRTKFLTKKFAWSKFSTKIYFLDSLGVKKICQRTNFGLENFS